MIQLPSQAEISYLRRFSVAAIYLIAVPTRPPMVLVGTATNIASSAAALVARRRGLFVAGKPLDIAWAGWLADGAANRLVHAVTSSRLPITALRWRELATRSARSVSASRRHARTARCKDSTRNSNAADCWRKGRAQGFRHMASCYDGCGLRWQWPRRPAAPERRWRSLIKSSVPIDPLHAAHAFAQRPALGRWLNGEPPVRRGWCDLWGASTPTIGLTPTAGWNGIP